MTPEITTVTDFESTSKTSFRKEPDLPYMCFDVALIHNTFIFTLSSSERKSIKYQNINPHSISLDQFSYL